MKKFNELGQILVECFYNQGLVFYLDYEIGIDRECVKILFDHLELAGGFPNGADYEGYYMTIKYRPSRNGNVLYYEKTCVNHYHNASIVKISNREDYPYEVLCLPFSILNKFMYEV